MVKFSVISCTFLWIVVIPGLFFIADYTEGKDQRVLFRTPEDHLHELSEEENRTSAVSPEKSKSSAGATRGQRSAMDLPSRLKFEMISRDRTNEELKPSERNSNSWLRETMPPQLFKVTNINGTNNHDAKLSVAAENKEPGGALDNLHRAKLTNVTDDIVIIPKLFNYNTTVRNDYSYVDSGSDGFIETNRGGSVNKTMRSLTLMNFEGPVIPQDLESLEDEALVNLEHIRVKRGFQDLDELDQRFMNDDKFDVKNELADIYPDSIDDPLNSKTGVELIRRKRLDSEMLFPRSSLESEDETQSLDATPKADKDLREQSKELGNDRYSFGQKNSDPKVITGPVFLESISNYEPQMKSAGSNLKRDTSDFVNSITNPTKGNGLISRSTINEIGDRFSQSKKKRYAQVEIRTRRRKGGQKKKRPGKGRRYRHWKKYKKKHKEKKKPARNTNKGRSADGSNGDSNFSNKHGVSRLVDEFQVEAHVEKRDSGDTRSEIDINKREISGNYDGNDEIQFNRAKRTVENEKNLSPTKKNNDERGTAECNKEQLRYYADVCDPKLRKQYDHFDANPESVDNEVGKKEAAKSVRQIKKLMERTIDKLGELETYVDTGKDEEIARGLRSEIGGDFSNSTNSNNEGADFKNITMDQGELKFCAGEMNGLKLKSGYGGIEKILSRRETSRKQKIQKRKTHRKWDKWTDWSSCSVTCGKGRQIRWRHCIHDCISAETEMEEKTCQLPACGPGKFLGIF